MARFNAATPGIKTVNRAGGRAFSMHPELELMHATLASFLKDEYYESGDARATRIAELVEEVSKKDPEFVAKLAKVARSEFHMRSVTTVLLGALSKNHRGDDLVKRAIVSATERVDDLTELAAYTGTPMPKQVKRGIRNALFKFNRYQLAKYRGEGKNMSLVDLFNLVHPKVQHASEEQAQAWKDLIEGNLKSEDTWESKVSAGKSEEDRAKAFSDLVLEGKMGYMALLRNLNNLVKYKVSDLVITAAVKKLTDPEEVKKSKQLPFRFLTAYQNVQGNRKLTDAITIAMEHAVSNVPKFDGKMLVAVDTSGSMTSGGVGDTAPIQKAAVFAAVLAKSNDADIMLYDTRTSNLPVSSLSTVVDTSNAIIKNAHGGGTETSIIFKKAQEDGKKYDRIIILSDNQSWVEGYSGAGVQRSYEQYKTALGTDPYVYAIDIQGYGTTDLMKSSKVFHLVGWSERMLDFMQYVEQGESLIDHIKSIEL